MGMCLLGRGSIVLISQVNTIILQKTWHQMQLAYTKGARDIWIVNVGDLKPLV
jgi:hypothetical protein